MNWAHPEFGQVMKGEMKVGKIRRGNFQVIATCSFDRTAAVWEEIVGEKSSGGLNHWVNPAASLKLSFIKFLFSLQVKKTSLVDSRTSVTDVKFGPKHLGLILATCSADGTVGDWYRISVQPSLSP